MALVCTRCGVRLEAPGDVGAPRALGADACGDHGRSWLKGGILVNFVFVQLPLFSLAGLWSEIEQLHVFHATFLGFFYAIAVLKVRFFLLWLVMFFIPAVQKVRFPLCAAFRGQGPGVRSCDELCSKVRGGCAGVSARGTTKALHV